MADNETLISVVTPFYNSVSTLEQCIRSVLAQTYTNFEYILADNSSTDGSSDLARDYAHRDPRIRYIYFDEHLPRTRNYNRALQQMAPTAAYCKMVQADDAIYPECLAKMLSLCLANPSVGVVSARRMIEDVIDPPESLVLDEVTDGREIVRRTLRDELYVFGSQTTVMYRADLVRARPDLFDETLYLNDVDAIFELLRHSDFGFCPEILSYTRRDPTSTYGSVTSFYPGLLSRYVTLRLRGRQFFPAPEAGRVLDDVGRTYYEALARAVFRPDRAALFRFHAKQLREAGLGWEYGRALQVVTGMSVRALGNRVRSALPWASG